MVVDWICKLLLFGGIAIEDWRSVVTVSLNKGKGEWNECYNYRGITLFKRGWKNVCWDISGQSP